MIIDKMFHKDGVPWYDAPVPRRWHRCWAQTTAWVNLIETVERCVCGSIRLDYRVWVDRNSRKVR